MCEIFRRNNKSSIQYICIGYTVVLQHNNIQITHFYEFVQSTLTIIMFKSLSNVVAGILLLSKSSININSKTFFFLLHYLNMSPNARRRLAFTLMNNNTMLGYCHFFFQFANFETRYAKIRMRWSIMSLMMISLLFFFLFLNIIERIVYLLHVKTNVMLTGSKNTP